MAGANARLQIGLGNYAKADRSRNSLYNQNGIRSSNFPNAKREGVASIMDRGIRRGDALKNKEALGEGAVSMSFFDEEGNPILGEDASISLHDVTFTADKTGRFRLVDQGFLDEKESQEKQKRKYIDFLTEKMVTDEIFQKTLGLNDADFENVTRPAGLNLDGSIPIGIMNSSARPSVMESYVPGSQLYMESLTKQRAIMRHFMPILQKKTETKTGDLDAKDSFASATNVQAGGVGGAVGGVVAPGP